MVEALVCTQDWLKGMPFSMLTNEDFEELERFEQEMTSPPEGTSSTAIDLD
ncbi:zinc finger BED domain-containing protein RICESLEEPER 2-like [Sesbania bispinosa]|nr:zinc finger BED domain-containing protein RICESLEEPER 2-like [Sesbania bispinosa]